MSHIHIHDTVIDLNRVNGQVETTFLQDGQIIACEPLQESEEDAQHRLGELIRENVPPEDRELVALNVALAVLTMSEY